MKETSIEILKRNHLSVTHIRLAIIDLLLKSEGGLTHGDFDHFIRGKVDRTTIYRSLQTFSEKGIVHTIPTADDTIRYALCGDSCTEGHHMDNHIHFSCESCGKNYCLDAISIPPVRLPKGFSVHKKDLVISGICASCK